MNYRLSIDYHAMRLIFALRAGRRSDVFRWMEQLTSEPFTSGTVTIRDETGRDIQVSSVSGLRIFYWADHPIKVVHVMKVEVDD